MDFEQELLVERPVSHAFRACDSPELQLRWIASLVEVERDPECEWGLGSRFRQVHLEAGVRQVFEGELLAYEPDQRIVLRLEHPDFVSTTELRFEDLGQRCRIRQRSKLELRSLPLKLMQGTVGRVVAKRFQEDFARLKVLLETS
jgi:uncharacterized protein YndB with AHSA1/START domain